MTTDDFVFGFGIALVLVGLVGFFMRQQQRKKDAAWRKRIW